MACNILYMFYSSNKDVSLQDGERAVKFGKRALEVSGERAEVLDTVACAYARNGNFLMAVKMQRKACAEIASRSRSGDQKVLAGYQYRLELFEQGKTWKNGMKP
jgi:hypothetical protein